ncbi:unnamed protein product [Rotaria socialis]|uniref:AIG1-type G domain-containing protein n=1 Tax=Rotaria socialis TaxID=392032 RepID=A0A820STU5_9BILA|nr:unnamed protein product [Rotaria socialis]
MQRQNHHPPPENHTTNVRKRPQKVENTKKQNCDLKPSSQVRDRHNRLLFALVPGVEQSMHASPTESLLPKEKRVVLIGCTGHGKGTLGNYLYNLGHPGSDGLSPIFDESAKLDPHTQDPYCHLLEIKNSPNASDARKRMSCNILDAPGLNDFGREKDLNHMIHVLEMISKQFHSIHALVLVYRFNTRIDATIEPALRYYRDLFAPLFRAHNVILVLTQVPSNDYELQMHNGSWESTIENHLDGCNKALELNESSWNCPIDQRRCFFVNSKWITQQIDELLEKIIKNEKLKDDLLYRSYLMREMILDYISEATEITLDSHLMSFPKALETERMSALRIIDGRIQELLNAVFIENEHRAMYLKDLDRLHTELTDIKTRIEQCKDDVKRLSATQ